SVARPAVKKAWPKTALTNWDMRISPEAFRASLPWSTALTPSSIAPCSSATWPRHSALYAKKRKAVFLCQRFQGFSMFASFSVVANQLAFGLEIVVGDEGNIETPTQVPRQSVR